MLVWLALASAADVCEEGCRFDTIQAAVDSVPPGGLRSFTVQPALYDETLSITEGRRITLTPPFDTLEPITLTNSVPSVGSLITVEGGALTLGGFSLDGNLGRAIDATDAEIRIYISTVFARGLATEGGLIRLQGGLLDMTFSVLREGQAGGEGGILLARNADVTISTSSFIGGGGGRGGCLAVTATGPERKTVSLDGTIFRGCTAASSAGSIYAEGAIDWVGSGLVIEEGSAIEGGGMTLAGSDLVANIDIMEVSSNESFAAGGGILVDGSTLTVSNVSLLDNQAETGGGALVRGGGRLNLWGVAVDTNVGVGSAGGIAIEDGELDTRDVAFLRNSAVLGHGGGLYLSADAQWVHDERTMFCENRARVGAAFSSRSSSDITVQNLRAFDNAALEEAGAVAHLGTGTLTLNFANLLGNSAGLGSGGAVLTSGPLELENTLIGWSIGSVAVVERDLGSVTLNRTAWFANERGNLKGLSPADLDTVFDDPLLDRFVPGEGCEVVQDWPRPASPLADSGDPTLLDPDGSPADIGAFGGPLAGKEVWETDSDGDGFPRIYDCDDGNNQVHPDVPDKPYDGLDSNCDAADDYDFDRDGFRSIDYGGTDCDDFNKRSYPGAPEAPNGKVDNNCDGRFDADLDGWEFVDDCDDADPLVYPGAPDENFRKDWDCNGVVDGPRSFSVASCQVGPGANLGWMAALLLGLVRRREKVRLL